MQNVEIDGVEVLRSRNTGQIQYAIGLFLIVLSFGGEAAASEPHRVPASTSVAVNVDGSLDDAVWQSALSLTLDYETDPGENTASKIETECKIVYDDTHLYVGCNATDPDPQQIRARLSDRDTVWSDDFVGIILDTFNDGRRAFEFFVNPLGVQGDMIYDDVVGNEDSSWNAIWNSAGRLHESGYSVEMEIPFSSLRFQRGEGDQIWGIDVMRNYPRDRRVRLGLNPLERGRDCYLCQASKIVGFKGATPGKNLEFTPTLVASRTDTGSPGDSLDAGDEDIEPGLTTRWGITPNLTLLGTVNPDFSQVEADSARLGINEAFALFFPERRPFFLEGADFFDTPVNAVYTRTVAAPDWGAKLTGKEGRNTFGIFVAEDEQTNILRPGLEGSSLSNGESNGSTLAGVFRFRRDIGKNSSIGLLGTAREGQDIDYNNYLGGIDGLFRPNNEHTLRFQLLASETRDELLNPAFDPSDPNSSAPETLVRDISDIAAWGSYRFNKPNYTLRASHSHYGDEFRADLGFIPRVNYSQSVVGGSYRFFGGTDTWYNRIELGGDWDQTHDQDGNFVESEWEGWATYSGPKQLFVWVGSGVRNRQFRQTYFDQKFSGAFIEVRPNRSLWFGLDLGLRDQLDFGFQPDIGSRRARQGQQLSIGPRITLRAGRRLQLNLNHDYRTLDLENDEGRAFTANLSEARLVYQFSVRTFLRWITQYETRDENPDVWLIDDPANPGSSIALRTPPAQSSNWFNQFLFSYKVNPQTALYVGYSDSRTDDGDPLLSLEPVARTFFIKLGYAWLPK